MISMGAYEGYITIASYDQAYVDFLYGADTPKGTQGFMKMHEYGPYDLQNQKAFRSFLCCVVALMENDAL